MFGIEVKTESTVLEFNAHLSIDMTSTFCVSAGFLTLIEQTSAAAGDFLVNCKAAYNMQVHRNIINIAYLYTVATLKTITNHEIFFSKYL